MLCSTVAHVSVCGVCQVCTASHSEPLHITTQICTHVSHSQSHVRVRAMRLLILFANQPVAPDSLFPTHPRYLEYPHSGPPFLVSLQIQYLPRRYSIPSQIQYLPRRYRIPLADTVSPAQIQYPPRISALTQLPPLGRS